MTGSPRTGTSALELCRTTDVDNLRRKGGVQGENNSCYIDVTIMCLFAFVRDFDGLLVGKSEIGAFSRVSNDERRFLQQFLVGLVVNPLRSLGFVPSAHMLTLRSTLSLILSKQLTNFIGAADEDDVNMFLERLRMVLEPTPTTSAAAQLLQHSPLAVDVMTCIVPGLGAERTQRVVTLAQVLEACRDTLRPSLVPQPLLINIARPDGGALPYGGVLPSLYLTVRTEPRDQTTVVGVCNRSSASASGGPSASASGEYMLQLSAIIVYDPSLRHYTALLKGDPMIEAGRLAPTASHASGGGDGSVAASAPSAPSLGWYHYDSMRQRVSTAIRDEFLPSVDAFDMSFFEDCQRHPQLEQFCAEVLLPSKEFREFLVRASRPGATPSMRPSPELSQQDVETQQSFQRKSWRAVDAAVHRPYLYLYTPCASASSACASSSHHVVPVDYYADVELDAQRARELLSCLETRRSWRDAVAAWNATFIEPLRPKPPPVVHGCPDCGQPFDSEEQFVRHMSRGQLLCPARQSPDSSSDDNDDEGFDEQADEVMRPTAPPVTPPASVTAPRAHRVDPAGTLPYDAEPSCPSGYSMVPSGASREEPQRATVPPVDETERHSAHLLASRDTSCPFCQSYLPAFGLSRHLGVCPTYLRSSVPVDAALRGVALLQSSPNVAVQQQQQRFATAPTQVLRSAPRDDLGALYHQPQLGRPGARQGAAVASTRPSSTTAAAAARGRMR